MNINQNTLPLGKDFILDINDDSLRSFLLHLPKVDLHRHVTGSLRFSTVKELLRNYNIELPRDIRRKIPLRDNPKQLERQITISTRSESTVEKKIESIWGILNRIIINKDIVYRIIYEAIEDAYKEGIIYLELRISPYGVMNGNGQQKRIFTFNDFLEALKEAIDKAALDFPSIICRIIISLPRHYLLRRFSSKDSIEEFDDILLKPCLEYKDKYIVGFDLAGKKGGYSTAYRDYVHWPLEDFRRFFKRIKEYGFGITIHAGENENAKSIEVAIEKLFADRIGHGINAISDEAIIRLLRETGTPLEICPTSNIKLNIIESLDSHPIRELQDMGIKTTINTDDPSVFITNTIDEYFNLIRNKKLKYNREEIFLNIINSFNSAFIAEHERSALVSRFRAYIEK